MTSLPVAIFVDRFIPGGTQRQSFADARNAVGIGTIERTCDLDDAVAIGVCLDDGEYFRDGRETPDSGEVVAQRPRVERRRGECHRNEPSP